MFAPAGAELLVKAAEWKAKGHFSFTSQHSKRVKLLKSRTYKRKLFDPSPGVRAYHTVTAGEGSVFSL